ncbi:hypothetical protein [Nonomuraea sp. NPDC049646]|uniref:hypothetical protein n=1 Tax=unclassified Nonomuraea TaxID=2593643 RepID=UPI0037BA134A
MARSGDAELSALYEEVLSYGLAGNPRPPDPAEIALPVRIGHRGAELRLVDTITTFGAAFDVTLEEIAVEACFPADDDTARFFRTPSVPA